MGETLPPPPPLLTTGLNHFIFQITDNDIIKTQIIHYSYIHLRFTHKPVMTC